MEYIINVTQEMQSLKERIKQLTDSKSNKNWLIEKLYSQYRDLESNQLIQIS